LTETQTFDLPDSVAALWAELGISADLLSGRRLPLHADPPTCVLVQRDADGREHLLTPEAAAAWAAMLAAAASEGVAMELLSAYRSVARQAEIIRSKLAEGQTIAEVLQAVAPPGCSEHHSGRAVDIVTPGQHGLDEDFERSPAFAWLSRRAGEFGFRLSYPRGNAEGYVYEPWHWCLVAPAT
jgi:D-alanyl-D-alanine carboxypeptidase